MKNIFKRGSIMLSISALVAMSGIWTVKADDTEVYFGKTSAANVLLVLDESGSMGWNTQTREGKTYDSFLYTGGTFQAKPSDDAYLQVYLCTRWRWGQCRRYVWTKNNNRRIMRWRTYRWKVDAEYRVRMDILKEAATKFINDLDENSRVGIMTYTTYGGSTGNTKLKLPVLALNVESGGETHKEKLLEVIDELDPQGGTPTADAMLQAARYYKGDYKNFASPIDKDCGLSNNIIVLSDGQPNSYSNSIRNRMKSFIGEGSSYSCEGIPGSIGNDAGTDGNAGEECTVDLADYASNHKLTNLEKSKVITSTVAFGLDSNTGKKFLKDVAEKGQGTYSEATDVDSLVEAFKASLASSVDTASLVAPSVPLSQSNRLRSGNEVFMAMFRPLSNNVWPGNLKKYYLKNGYIHSENVSATDKIGDAAVDQSTGVFFDNATSAWSNQDGNDLLKGGVNRNLGGPGVPVYSNLFSNNLSGNAKNKVSNRTSSFLSEDQIETLFGDDVEKEDALEYFTWVSTKSVEYLTDLNGDGQPDTIDKFGDPLHAKPVVVNYNNNNQTVYLMTNQGYLHAINPKTGTLRWSFMPRDLLKKVPNWKKNAVLGSPEDRDYGLDGGMTLSIIDKNKDGIIKPAEGDKRILYFGQRRGGHQYYALDVTRINAPKMKFSIKSTIGQTDNSGFYRGEKITTLPQFGQSWSSPMVATTQIGSTKKRVLYITGGYDTKNDKATFSPSSANQTGTRIMGLDADTGAPISGFSEKMKAINVGSSMPASLSLVDLDSDGVVDYIYGIDIAGSIYRVRLPKKTDMSDFKAGIIAKLGQAGVKRRFYNKLDVAFATYQGKRIAFLGVGSGYRAHPKEMAVQDRYHVIYDRTIDTGNIPAGSDRITIAKMHDATGNSTTRFAELFPKKSGWYITLPKGEKILSDGITVNFRSFFTTYSPGTAEKACSVATGTNKLYGVNILDGSPIINQFIKDNNGDPRSLDLNYAGGIAPNVIFLFPSDTQVAALVGSSTINTGESLAEDLGLSNVLTTMKWKEVQE